MCSYCGYQAVCVVHVVYVCVICARSILLLLTCAFRSPGPILLYMESGV